MINISLNNEIKRIDENTTLLELISHYFNDNPYLAAAINNEFVAKSRYHDTFLIEGDTIDIVSPVGGG